MSNQVTIYIVFMWRTTVTVMYKILSLHEMLQVHGIAEPQIGPTSNIMQATGIVETLWITEHGVNFA
jgi:hypothetical protein